MAERRDEPTTPDVEDLDVPEEDAEDVKGGGGFLKLDGIKGESLDDKHKGEFI